MEALGMIGNQGLGWIHRGGRRSGKKLPMYNSSARNT